MEKKKKKRGLTLKQQKFIAAYVGNATDAARKAGYPEKSARQQGNDLLTNPYIMDALAEKMQNAISPLIAEKTKRLEWLVAEMNNKKHHITSRLKAYELLAKSCGDFLTPGIIPTGQGQAPPTVIVIRPGKDSPTNIMINGPDMARGEALPLNEGIGDELPDGDGGDWMDGEELPEKD